MKIRMNLSREKCTCDRCKKIIYIPTCFTDPQDPVNRKFGTLCSSCMTRSEKVEAKRVSDHYIDQMSVDDFFDYSRKYKIFLLGD